LQESTDHPRISGITLITFTGVMVSLTKGSFVIPLVTAGVIASVGAASYLFIVGEIAPLPPRSSPGPRTVAAE